MSARSVAGQDVPVAGVMCLSSSLASSSVELYSMALPEMGAGGRGRTTRDMTISWTGSCCRARPPCLALARCGRNGAPCIFIF